MAVFMFFGMVGALMGLLKVLGVGVWFLFPGALVIALVLLAVFAGLGLL